MTNNNEMIIEMFSNLSPELKDSTKKILRDAVNFRNKQEAKVKGISPMSFKVGQKARVKQGASVPKKWWGQVLTVFHVSERSACRVYLENPVYLGMKFKCIYPLTNEIEHVN